MPDYVGKTQLQVGSAEGGNSAKVYEVLRTDALYSLAFPFDEPQQIALGASDGIPPALDFFYLGFMPGACQDCKQVFPAQVSKPTGPRSKSGIRNPLHGGFPFGSKVAWLLIKVPASGDAAENIISFAHLSQVHRHTFLFAACALKPSLQLQLRFPNMSLRCSLALAGLHQRDTKGVTTIRPAVAASWAQIFRETVFPSTNRETRSQAKVLRIFRLQGSGVCTYVFMQACPQQAFAKPFEQKTISFANSITAGTNACSAMVLHGTTLHKALLINSKSDILIVLILYENCPRATWASFASLAGRRGGGGAYRSASRNSPSVPRESNSGLKSVEHECFAGLAQERTHDHNHDYQLSALRPKWSANHLNVR